MERKRVADGDDGLEIVAFARMDPGGHRQERGIIALTDDRGARLSQSSFRETYCVELGDPCLSIDTVDAQRIR